MYKASQSILRKNFKSKMLRLAIKLFPHLWGTKLKFKADNRWDVSLGYGSGANIWVETG